MSDFKVIQTWNFEISNFESSHLPRLHAHTLVGVAARMVQALVARAANLVNPAAVGGGLAEVILQVHKHMSIHFNVYFQETCRNKSQVSEQLPATTTN